MGSYITLCDVRAIRETERAILVDCEDLGGEVWIPLSQVNSDESEALYAGQRGDLVITEWIYEQKLGELAERREKQRAVDRMFQVPERTLAQNLAASVTSPTVPVPVKASPAVPTKPTAVKQTPTPRGCRTLAGLLDRASKSSGEQKPAERPAEGRSAVTPSSPPALAPRLRGSLAALIANAPPPEPKKDGPSLFERWDDIFGAPHPNSRAAKLRAIAGPQRTNEFERIVAMPRRVIDLTKVTDLTSRFARPGGTWKLRPAQSAALAEMQMLNGLFGVLDLGVGKTLLDLLSPLAMDSKKAVLFIPSSLRAQLFSVELPIYRQHFHLPRVVDGRSTTKPVDGAGCTLFVLAYEDLSRGETAGRLAEIEPDLVIFDEVQRILRSGSARHRRVRGEHGYLTQHPECRVVAWSGSTTKKSLKDYAWMLEATLRKDAPVPNKYRELESWALAIDVPPDDETPPGPPGILKTLCEPGEHVREGFRRRLRESPGVVVASVGELVEAGLVVRERRCALPDVVTALYARVDGLWELDEDNPLPDALARDRALKQVAAGFYHVWVWPDGVPDREWIAARKAWHKEVRELLRHRSRPKLDSEKFAREAAIRGAMTDLRPGSIREIEGKWAWKSEAWSEWDRVRDRPEPPVKVVWVDDFLARDALAWCQEPDEEGEVTGGIIWVESPALGLKIEELSRGAVPYLGAGDSERIAALALRPQAGRACVTMSRKVAGTGANLQYAWKRAYFLEPCNGLELHQAIGRLHRPGQAADEVVIDWASSTPISNKSFGTACKQTRYVRQTQGIEWKLGVATLVGPGTEGWKEILNSDGYETEDENETETNNENKIGDRNG